MRAFCHTHVENLLKFIDISPTIPYLAKFWISSYGPKCCQSIKLQDSLIGDISRKKCMMKLIFGLQINIKVFYKLIVPFWMCGARYAQSTQNIKFSYLQKNVGDKFDFWTHGFSRKGPINSA